MDIEKTSYDSMATEYKAKTFMMMLDPDRKMRCRAACCNHWLPSASGPLHHLFYQLQDTPRTEAPKCGRVGPCTYCRSKWSVLRVFRELRVIQTQQTGLGFSTFSTPSKRPTEVCSWLALQYYYCSTASGNLTCMVLFPPECARNNTSNYVLVLVLIEVKCYLLLAPGYGSELGFSVLQPFM
jgi:hypothetical protein